jgi:hypothetical protein
MERDLSGSHRDRDSIPASSSSSTTYWLKRGEWRRTKSVVGFAFLVTLCCVGVKIVTALIGRGVWSGRSHFLRLKIGLTSRHVCVRYCHCYAVLSIQSVRLCTTCQAGLYSRRARGGM